MRKALNDSAAEAKYLTTIPKRGYRFTATVKIKEKSNGVHSPKKFIFTSYSLIISTLVILVLVTSLIYIKLDEPSSSHYQFGNPKLLTSLEGREDNGRISNDGQNLLFRHKAVDGGNWQLFIQALFDNRKYDEYDNSGKKTGKILASNRALSEEVLIADDYNYSGMPESEQGLFKVIRGGVLQTHLNIKFSPTYFRNWMEPKARYNFLGFRCARDVQ